MVRKKNTKALFEVLSRGQGGVEVPDWIKKKPEDQAESPPDAELSKEDLPLPASEEELNEWLDKYPDTAKVIESLIIKNSQEASKPLEERLNQIEKREKKVSKREAEVEISRKHSDYKQLQDLLH